MLNTKNIQRVDESKRGVYVWEMPDGRIVGDDEGRFLSIESEYGDGEKIKSLNEVVRYYGVEQGWPKFFPGHRKVSDYEYEDQQERMNDGKIPDPLDPGAAEGDV